MGCSRSATDAPRTKRNSSRKVIIRKYSYLFIGHESNRWNEHGAFRRSRLLIFAILRGTFGYLQDVLMHLPVVCRTTPDEFLYWNNINLSIDFGGVESGQLVRSCFHADEQSQKT